MPECAFHPGVETSVRCVECNRYMCPKDYVNTPVGYKCKECARQLPSARRAVKPRQLALATLAALAVGVGGAFLLAVIGFRFWLATVLLGVLTGEAARRGAPRAGIARRRSPQSRGSRCSSAPTSRASATSPWPSARARPSTL